MARSRYLPLPAFQLAVLAAALLAPRGSASAEPGVTDNEVVLGMPAAFSGPSAGLGVEVWRGATAAFEEVNAAGGVHGRTVRLELGDDAYDPDRAVPVMLDLIDEHHVFALFSGVGTPTTLRTLPPLLKFHAAEGLFHFGSITGAQPLREPPYGSAFVNIRASYRQETEAMIRALLASGHGRIGLFVQDDSFGTSGREAVRRALDARGRTIVAETTYPRGMRFDGSTRVQVDILRRAGVDAVIAACSYQACAALVRDARQQGWTAPILTLSFAGGDQMLALIHGEEQRSGRRLTQALFVAKVVPSYRNTQLPLVREYRHAMEDHAPQGPPPVGDASYQPPGEFSYGSLEGYLNARVFLEVLRRTGPDLTRAGFRRTALRMGNFDEGLGVALSFSDGGQLQALDTVWFSRAGQEGWREVPDLVDALR